MTSHPDWVPNLGLHTSSNVLKQAASNLERYNRRMSRHQKQRVTVSSSIELQEPVIFSNSTEPSISNLMDLEIDSTSVNAENQTPSQETTRISVPVSIQRESEKAKDCATQTDNKEATDFGMQTESQEMKEFITQTECIEMKEFTTQTELIEMKGFMTQTDILEQSHLLMEELKHKLQASEVLQKQFSSEVMRLQSKLEQYKKDLDKMSFVEASFMEDNKRVNFFTGLGSYEMLMVVYKQVQPFLAKTSTKLTEFQQLLLTSVKLRLGLSNIDLAYRFCISESTVGRVFHMCLNILYIRLGHLVSWPSRDDLRKTMPNTFREKFGDKVTIIIDCFEVFIDRPSGLEARVQTWSNYKHHHTVKFLIGIAPQGAVTFISEGWGGRVSDKHLAENCGLLDKLNPGDVILADRGFDINESVGFWQAEVKIPAFTRGKNQLAAKEVESTRNLAHVRIHVERVIGLLRQKYKILHVVNPLELLGVAEGELVATIDKIATVTCAFTNLSSSVIPFD